MAQSGHSGAAPDSPSGRTFDRYLVRLTIRPCPPYDVVALVDLLTRALHGTADVASHDSLVVQLVVPAGSLFEACEIAVGAMRCACATDTVHVDLATAA